MSLLLSFPLFSQTTPTLKSLSTVDFSKLLETKTVLLVDVRTVAEFSQGHIPGALNVDVNDPEFVNTIKTLNKGKPLALYCRSGRRSKLAASKLTGSGINIYDLDYGFLDWIKAGLPVSVGIKR